MLTIEQYIEKMKKKDKLDEFNFKNHAVNMSTVMKYVMDYFNNYLDPEAYDYERIKLEQSISKIERELGQDFPKSKEFIFEYYRTWKSRIDKILKSWMKELRYLDLYYSKEDYEYVAEKFCNSSKMKGTGVGRYKEQLVILVQEIKESQVEEPSLSGFKYLDSSLVAWAKETFRNYGVNLFQFAREYTWIYYEEYVERIYKRESETFYHINRYNHRYNENPFDMDDLYSEHSHRPFIQGKKGELEMLIMYVWLFEDAYDSDYWPEYVNLCVSAGRVKTVKRVNVLMPVINDNIPYPVEVKSTEVLVKTVDGSLKKHPDGEYVLRLHYPKDNDIIWKDPDKFNQVIDNLLVTFNEFGPPNTLELLSPLRTPSFNEDEFFNRYQVLEKRLKKYTGVKIALVNGPHRRNSNPNYLVQTSEDILRIRNMAKEMKYKLRFVVDLTKLIQRKNYQGDFEEDFNRLGQMRNLIIGVHLSRIVNSSRTSSFRYQDDKIHLNKSSYHYNSDFLGSISALFNDNQRRYFVPEGIKNAAELEELIDSLLRGGFSFGDQEGDSK
ncbi:MAG: hypothetical protein E6230_24945 [Paenibacillus dendritiformis]|uniref:hypothetical protein n=1 Tax=uncultured Paenibacillus sp. TaxID=227322 RepID=UPI0025CC8E6C|nr:hypothetical protein [uncultured Paenibacillus sp.]MDU5145428.1 hypothetical protein [Paenibacillus dendritiformis]